MTMQGFLSLALQSVTAPREVARLLLSLRLGQEALLTAFALVVVLNALAFSTSLLIAPVQGPVSLLSNPAIFLMTQAGALLASIVAFTYCGRAMGGTGTANGVAVLLIWLQMLRVLVQTVLLVVLPLAPVLAGVVMFTASALGVWILVHFMDEAHGFGSLFKSALLLVFGVVGIALVLTLLLTLAGVDPNGNFANV